jgi:hypothetical protein
MDINDGFATSSKEHLRSLVRVLEPDEITSNGGEDRSVTKEHPRGLKRKRPNFMHGEPPSWKRGWHCQNHASGRGKVHKCMRTHGSEGATEPGRTRPTPDVGSPPPFLALEGFSTLKPWRCRHSRGGEPFVPEAHPQAREEEGDLWRGIDHLEGSTHKWRRRKTPSEGWPWSTVLCLAPWWGNLLIRPWVVIDLEM